MLIGMGEQKTNESLAQACDEFKVLDLIYQVQDNEEPEEVVAKEEPEEEAAEDFKEEGDLLDIVKTISIPSKQEIIEIILDTLDDDWENLASVGAALNKQISGFDARNYGYRNMTQFIKNNADKFELSFETSRDGIHSVVYVRKKVK